MNKNIPDIVLLAKKHWKFVLLIVIAIWLFNNYADIKSGFIDGYTEGRK